MKNFCILFSSTTLPHLSFSFIFDALLCDSSSVTVPVVIQNPLKSVSLALSLEKVRQLHPIDPIRISCSHMSISAQTSMQRPRGKSTYLNTARTLIIGNRRKKRKANERSRLYNNNKMYNSEHKQFKYLSTLSALLEKYKNSCEN